jgi:hypothetical protein
LRNRKRQKLEPSKTIIAESTPSESLSIDDISEEMLAIAFGMEEFNDAISFIIGESLSDFAQA